MCAVQCMAVISWADSPQPRLTQSQLELAKTDGDLVRHACIWCTIKYVPAPFLDIFHWKYTLVLGFFFVIFLNHANTFRIFLGSGLGRIVCTVAQKWDHNRYVRVVQVREHGKEMYNRFGVTYTDDWLQWRCLFSLYVIAPFSCFSSLACLSLYGVMSTTTSKINY